MDQSLTPVSRSILVTASLVIVIFGVKQAAPIIIPFLLSIFIAVISYPMMYKLQQKGVPKGLSLVLVILLVVIASISLMLLVGSSLAQFSQDLPGFKEKISVEWVSMLAWFNQQGIPVKDTMQDLLDPSAAVGFVSSILVGFGGVLKNSFLILLAVIFILIEASAFNNKLEGIIEDKSQGDKDTDDFMQVFLTKVRDYMSIKTIISLMTGVIIGISMWLVGVDYPVLWGILAFILNFIPTIGSIMAAVPAVLLALVQLGGSAAIVTAVIYLVVNMLISSVIEPRFMGKGLGLSILVVFVSLIFWGWVLGPVGMLLSVPLTITIKLALDSRLESQWIGRMLG